MIDPTSGNASSSSSESSFSSGAGERSSDERAAIVRRLAEWIDLDSTTGRESSYAEAVASHLEARNWAVLRLPVDGDRCNLLARTAEGDLDLLFTTHLDTVPPHFGHRLDGDLLRGRGACDTKGGVVALIEAANQIRATRPEAAIGLLFVVGEEVDHCGAIAARDLSLGAPHSILCEPTRNRLVSHQKGLLKVAVEVAGRAAHSGFPDRGISAIDALLDALHTLRHRPSPSHPALGPTTLNVGLIEAGVAANVIPPRASATLMFRLVEPAATVLDEVKAALDTSTTAIGATYALTIMTELDPLELDVPPGPWETTVANFNSDAVHMAVHGPVTMVGPGDIEVAHSVDEHIPLPELFAGIDLYVELSTAILDQRGVR